MEASHQPRDRIPQGWHPFAQSDKNWEKRPFEIPRQSQLDQQGPQNHLVSDGARTEEMELGEPNLDEATDRDAP